MRIALVSDTYAPSINGVATFTAGLAHQLAADGHQVAVLAPAAPGVVASESSEAVQEMRFASVPLPLYSEARLCIRPQLGARVHRLLDEFQPDVVHAQTHFFLAKRVLNACDQLHVPVVATCHSNSENFLLNMPILGKITPHLSRMYWRDAVSFYSKTSLLTVPAAPMADVLRRWGFRGPITPVPNGVDTSFFNPDGTDHDEEVRLRYGIPEGEALLFVGRLDADKGVSALIALMGKLAGSHRGSLIVCGSGHRENLLRRAASELGIAHRVIFTGAIPAIDLASVYRMSSALVMAGKNEIQPMAILEAMASGLPVICLRTKNLEATVEDGVNGLLADRLDAMHELAQLLFDDHALQTRLGKNARQAAASRFSLRNAAQQFLTCYASVGTTVTEPAGRSSRH